MSESSKTPETFFGFKHTDGEIKDFVAKHVHKSENREGTGLLGKLFGKHTTTIEFDNKGIIDATSSPLVHGHVTEPKILEGQFWTDKKGRMHRIRK